MRGHVHAEGAADSLSTPAGTKWGETSHSTRCRVLLSSACCWLPKKADWSGPNRCWAQRGWTLSFSRRDGWLTDGLNLLLTHSRAVHRCTRICRRLGRNLPRTEDQQICCGGVFPPLRSAVQRCVSAQLAFVWFHVLREHPEHGLGARVSVRFPSRLQVQFSDRAAGMHGFSRPSAPTCAQWPALRTFPPLDSPLGWVLEIWHSVFRLHRKRTVVGMKQLCCRDRFPKWTSNVDPVSFYVFVCNKITDGMLVCVYSSTVGSNVHLFTLEKSKMSKTLMLHRHHKEFQFW